MNKRTFDKWCASSLTDCQKELIKKYPKCRETISEDVADFYINVVEKDLNLTNPKGYLFAFIYNRHYRYFSNQKAKLTGHLEWKTNCKIKLMDYPIDAAEIEPDDSEKTEQLERILILVNQLPLDYQNLYRLYYVEGKSTRQIASLHKLTHSGIHKQIKKLQNKIKTNL